MKPSTQRIASSRWFAVTSRHESCSCRLTGYSSQIADSSPSSLRDGRQHSVDRGLQPFKLVYRASGVAQRTSLLYSTDMKACVDDQLQVVSERLCMCCQARRRVL